MGRRDKNYAIKWQLCGPDGTPQSEDGWFFQVRKGEKNIRLLPVDLNAFNAQREDRNQPLFGPDSTLMAPVSRAITPTKTELAGRGKSSAVAGNKHRAAAESQDKSKRFHGDATANLAICLGRLVQELGLSESYRVVCAHRGKYEHAVAGEALSAGVSFRHNTQMIGDGHTSSNRFAVADIVIADKDLLRAILVIEVEESMNGVHPKVPAGDATIPIIADRIDICDEEETCRSLSLEGVEIWVAHYPRKRDDRSRTGILEGRLNDLLAAWTAHRARQGQRPGPTKIRLFNHSRNELYAQLIQQARDLLGSRSSS